jgi:hypothetical protein
MFRSIVMESERKFHGKIVRNSRNTAIKLKLFIEQLYYSHIVLVTYIESWYDE